MQAGFGPHAIDELYRSPVGRHLSWGPLCGPQMAPGLKKALFGSEGRARFPTSGHALLSLLDAGSAGLGAVLAALGTSSNLLRLAARERLRQATYPSPQGSTKRTLAVSRNSACTSGASGIPLAALRSSSRPRSRSFFSTCKLSTA